MQGIIHYNGDQVVTLKEAARLLDTSVSAIHNRQSRGRIDLAPVTKVGHEGLYLLSDVKRLAKAGH